MQRKGRSLHSKSSVAGERAPEGVRSLVLLPWVKANMSRRISHLCINADRHCPPPLCPSSMVSSKVHSLPLLTIDGGTRFASASDCKRFLIWVSAPREPAVDSALWRQRREVPPPPLRKMCVLLQIWVKWFFATVVERGASFAVDQVSSDARAPTPTGLSTSVQRGAERTSVTAGS